MQLYTHCVFICVSNRSSVPLHYNSITQLYILSNPSKIDHISTESNAFSKSMNANIVPILYSLSFSIKIFNCAKTRSKSNCSTILCTLYNFPNFLNMLVVRTLWTKQRSLFQIHSLFHIIHVIHLIERSDEFS